MSLPEIQKPENDVFSRQLDEQKPRKSRGRRFLKGLGITTLVLASAGFIYAKFTPQGISTTQTWTEIGKGIFEAKTNPNLVFDNAGSSHVNILLIGRDVNWKPAKVLDPTTGKFRPFHVHDKDSRARSDTMIVVTLDKEKHTIRMVSLPRDAMVHIPGHGREKLNAAHAFGGPELLVKTLHDELGLTIHRYAVVKFEGFKKLIDQVGGVHVNVDGALKKDRKTGKLYRGNLDYDDNWGNLHIHLKPGPQVLDGEAAHAYVRFRMDREGDTGRIRRQQAVMRALAKEIMHTSPFRVTGVIQEVQKQFESNLTTSEMASAAQFARNMGDAGKIQPLTLFGAYSRRGVCYLNRSKNEKLLAYLFGPTFNSDRFLQESPSTREDEFGPTNDASAEAKQVLREAGIIKSDDEVEPGPGFKAPVRVEETHEASTSSPRRGRYAAVASENSSDESAESPRRRSRRSREESRSSRKTRESSDDSGNSSSRRSTSEESTEKSNEGAGSDILGGATAREESGSSSESHSESTEPAAPKVEAPAETPSESTP